MVICSREQPDYLREESGEHVRSGGQAVRYARQVWAALEARMEEVGLRLHPDKTKLVYCKDTRRRGSSEHTSFRFLGYTFAPRKARYPDGKAFTSFLPAVSPEALKVMGQQVREWRIHRRTRLELIELADWINPIVSGWMTYYGRFYRSQLYPFRGASTPT